MKRVFLIVLDSVGAGALPDAAQYGDTGAHTVQHIAADPHFRADTMCSLGYGNIEGLSFLGAVQAPRAAYGRCMEQSAGKDTTVGHWEIAGLISAHPFPTYPDGFPKEILEPFERITGRGILCNRPYSGTECIKRFGEAHMLTGDLIVYTSGDSVFQIAAHEDIVPPETLYAYCRAARRLLQGEHGVARVIARPFAGEPGSFYRTANRRDFSLEPPSDTMLDVLCRDGQDVIAVGKISDIFLGRGITQTVLTHSNTEGMAAADLLVGKNFRGVCFINLVDFDQLWGHRNDVAGYAGGFADFDQWLSRFTDKLGDDDTLIITADHGCDPGSPSTDHTREYTPLLVYGKKIKAVPLGTRSTFADIGKTVCDLLGCDAAAASLAGESFADEILCDTAPASEEMQ
ncbi:MAG: phosphopentomutase [Ruminococcaceae bacterium]|nr:phosphopentomutase [Oscillospiraceae bacterium]